MCKTVFQGVFSSRKLYYSLIIENGHEVCWANLALFVLKRLPVSIFRLSCGLLTIARTDAHFQAVFQGFLRKTAIDFSHGLVTTNIIWANLAHIPFREIGRFAFIGFALVHSY